MLKLLNVLVDICLLRRGPQDLPRSQTFALAAVIIYGMVVVYAEQRLGNAERALSWTALSLSLLLGAVYALLSLRGVPERFQQTTLALCGCSVIYLAAYLPVSLALAAPPGAEPSGLMSLLALIWLGLFFWAFIMEGNIYRHALGLSLPAGVLISTLFYAGAMALYYGFFAESP